MVEILIRAHGDDVVRGKFHTIDAIQQLQAAIETLRRGAAPVFDASFGEQPSPVLAPSADELHQFIHR